MAAESMLMVISSDEEDATEGVSDPVSKHVNEKKEEIEDYFVTLLTMFGKVLQDQKRLKILCRMHNSAPENFKSSEQFKMFIKNIISELKESPDRENALLLMTSVCQTLGLKEVMWSPKRKQKNSSNNSSSAAAEKKDNIGVVEDSPSHQKNNLTRDRASPSQQTPNVAAPTTCFSESCSGSTTIETNTTTTTKLFASPSNVGVTDTIRSIPKRALSIDLKRIENIAKMLRKSQEKDSSVAKNQLQTLKTSKISTSYETPHPSITNNYSLDSQSRKENAVILQRCSVNVHDLKYQDGSSKFSAAFSTLQYARNTPAGNTPAKSTVVGPNKNKQTETWSKHIKRKKKKLSKSADSRSISTTSDPFQRVAHKDDRSSNVTVIVLDDDEDDHVATDPKSVKRDQTQRIPSKKKICEVSPKKISKKILIGNLEKKLELMEKQIATYNEKELSLKDMKSEDSVYMLESRLKENFVKTWRRYCKLIGEDADEIVATKKKIKVTASPFPEINRMVQNYVNRTGNFPNMFEVKQVCLQANDKHNLDLKPNDLHNCAVEVFTEVGQKLQKNRERELRRNAGNLLTDQVKLEDDPAYSDIDLKRKLKHNRKLAKKRTNEVFQDFVRQQYEQETATAQTTASSDSADDSDQFEMLEKLRRNDLIGNKKLKRELIKKNASIPPAKKIRKDKTVISVTVSSSQERETPKKKVDYKVTIGSPLPKSKKSKTNQKRVDSMNESNESDFDIAVKTNRSNSINVETEASTYPPFSAVRTSETLLTDSPSSSASETDTGSKSTSRFFETKQPTPSFVRDVGDSNAPSHDRSPVQDIQERKTAGFSTPSPDGSYVRGIQDEKTVTFSTPSHCGSLKQDLENSKAAVSSTKSFSKEQLKIKPQKRLLTEKAILGVTDVKHENISASYKSPLDRFSSRSGKATPPPVRDGFVMIISDSDSDD